MLDQVDRDLLGWLVAARCALSTQVHRRMRPGRALTSTQRQLKRLADAGLVARFQLYRDDGGGVPLCCAATAATIELLDIRGRTAPALHDQALPALRNDVHTAAWLLALEAVCAGSLVEVLGPGRAIVAPGTASVAAPSALEIEPGVRPRDFILSGAGGVRTPVARFAPVRPDAVVEFQLDGPSPRHADLLVVQEPVGAGSEWLERYDHLVSGWWRTVPRYARLAAPPFVIVLCRDEARALACVREADALLCATLARIGADPLEWERPGRALIRFAAEATLHEGSLAAWQVPLHPPALRGGDSAEPVAVDLAPIAIAGASGPSGEARPPWR
jgi:hypothetical protein